MVGPMLAELAKAFLLLLGLGNPLPQNTLDSFLLFFVFGFSLPIFAARTRLVLALLTTAAACLVVALTKTITFPILLGILIGATTGIYLTLRKGYQRIAIFVLLISFVASAIVTSGDLRQFLGRELPVGTYNNDPGMFLKTYQLMEGGADYYEAYKQAQLGKFQQIVPGDVWGWRLPTILLIWKAIPGQSAVGIWAVYLVLSVGILYLAYGISCRYLKPDLGLLSPYLLFPYFHYAMRDQMFLETEWWSVVPFIAGIYTLLNRRLMIATILFTLTVLIREVYLLPIGLLFVFALLRERRLVVSLLLPFVVFSLVFLYHVTRVDTFINAWGTLFTPRVVSNGLLFVQQTLAFASWEYLFFGLRPFILFLVFAVVGCVHLYHRGLKRDSLILLSSFLPFPLAFLRFGTLPYNDYWGIIYVPIAVLLAPLSLGFLLKLKERVASP